MYHMLITLRSWYEMYHTPLALNSHAVFSSYFTFLCVFASDHVMVSALNVCKINSIGRSHTLLHEIHETGDGQTGAYQRWTAPEVLKTRIASVAGDVWSFGVTM